MNLESLGKEPISQDQPTGSDVRFEPLFEELQTEVGKVSSLSGPGSVDWGKVVKLSSEILAEKSKDLLAASYLAVALTYQRQVEGFAIGLKIYQDLLETFWERLYPTKMKGRAGAVEWWIEKSQVALSQMKQRALPEDQIQILNERLEKIEEFVSQHLEEPPSFRPIQDQLETLTPPPPEKPKEAPPPPPQEKTVRPEPEVPAAITSGQDAQKALNQGFQRIREAVTFLHQENLSNPQPYRWSRILLWSNVESLPPATNGQTRIMPPPAQVKNILSELKHKGDYENLIRSAEARLPQFIFWIDLNRYVSEGLAHLGETFQKAKEVVDQETAFLLHRLPGLESLSFSDGTPFADPDTRQWMKEIAFRGGSEEVSPTSATLAPPQEKNSIEKEVEEAQTLIKKGRLLEAIQGLQQKLQHSSSQRERLLWRLALSQLLVKNKQAKVALPHLDQIFKEVDFYKLEEYDPELAIQCLKAVWMGFSAQPDQPSKEKASEALQRIAKLDLTEAIRIGKT